MLVNILTRDNLKSNLFFFSKLSRVVVKLVFAWPFYLLIKFPKAKFIYLRDKLMLKFLEKMSVCHSSFNYIINSRCLQFRGGFPNEIKTKILKCSYYLLLRLS